jgi:hypothetical protein
MHRDGRGKPGHDVARIVLFHPLDNAQVAHGPIAQRLQRLLICWAVMGGNCSLDTCCGELLKMKDQSMDPMTSEQTFRSLPNERVVEPFSVRLDQSGSGMRKMDRHHERAGPGDLAQEPASRPGRFIAVPVKDR